MYYTWTNIKNPNKNNRFKISAPTQNEKFELPHGSQFISDIQDYFEYILKGHGEKINYSNPSIKIYVNKTEKRTTFKIERRYYLELLTLFL